jgi:hypothetical protein
MSKTSILHLTYDMHIGDTEMLNKKIIEGADKALFDTSIFFVKSPIGHGVRCTKIMHYY